MKLDHTLFNEMSASGDALVFKFSFAIQAMMLSLQERLSMSIAEAHQAQQVTTTLERRLHVLEVEKTLAANAEQRLTANISQVTLPFIRPADDECCNQQC